MLGSDPPSTHLVEVRVVALADDGNDHLVDAGAVQVVYERRRIPGDDADDHGPLELPGGLDALERDVAHLCERGEGRDHRNSRTAVRAREPLAGLVPARRDREQRRSGGRRERLGNAWNADRTWIGRGELARKAPQGRLRARGEHAAERVEEDLPGLRLDRRRRLGYEKPLQHLAQSRLNRQGPPVSALEGHCATVARTAASLPAPSVQLHSSEEDYRNPETAADVRSRRPPGV
jgi:hypothetical protein